MKFMRILMGLLTLLGTMGLTQSQDNYFQIRYFTYFPSQIAAQSWLDRVTVDASLVWNFAVDSSTAKLAFSITNTNLINQAIKLEGTSSSLYALMQFEGGIGSQLNARKTGLISMLAYTVPRRNTSEVQFLSNISLTYMYQSDTAATSGFSLNYADLSVRGGFALGWAWGAGYNISITSAASQTLPVTAQVGKFDVRGVMDGLELASRTQLRASDDGKTQNTTVDERLEAKLKLTEFEDLSAAYHIATQPNGAATQDDQSLAFTTSRPKPFSFSANIGRRSPDILNWGTNATFQEGGWSGLLDYAGTGGSNRDHNLQTSLGYREREWGVKFGLTGGLTLDPSLGFWYGRVGSRLEGSYKIAPWNFSIRTGLDYRASSNLNQSPWSSSLDLKGSYGANPLRLELGLNFTLRQSLSGKASAQMLYSIVPNLSLNLSLDYLSILHPVSAQQLGLSLGMRYGF